MTSWCHPRPAATAVRGLSVGRCRAAGWRAAAADRPGVARALVAAAAGDLAVTAFDTCAASLIEGGVVAGDLLRRYGGCDAAAHHPFVFGRHALPDNPRETEQSCRSPRSLR